MAEQGHPWLHILYEEGYGSHRLPAYIVVPAVALGIVTLVLFVAFLDDAARNRPNGPHGLLGRFCYPFILVFMFPCLLWIQFLTFALIRQNAANVGYGLENNVGHSLGNNVAHDMDKMEDNKDIENIEDSVIHDLPDDNQEDTPPPAYETANQEHHGVKEDAVSMKTPTCSQTRVIFQGFTGRQATANAQESLAWGTNVVGGVTPGKEGEHLGLPVLPSVRRAMEELKPDATGIYVPASQATQAIEEAIEAEIPLIVAVAEHIPLHDMLRIHSMLKTQSKSRLVGPNSPGIISSARGERCRIGFQPLPCFSEGCVGIAAKSGTLSYEAVASTTRAGLGQSLCIGVGGDILPGTDLVEALQVLEHDPNTRGIALIGEIGGDGEIFAAQWIRDYHRRTPPAQIKPIVALIAGTLAPRDRVMGHAGAFWMPGEPIPDQKIQALKAEGVKIVTHPAKIGKALKRLIEKNPASALAGETKDGFIFESVDDFAKAASGIRPNQQRRGLHTSARSTLNNFVPSRPLSKASFQQTRALHLDRSASRRLLEEGSPSANFQFDELTTCYLALGIDRATRSQCLITAVLPEEGDGWLIPSNFNKLLLPPTATDILSLYGTEQWDTVVSKLISQLKLSERGGSSAGLGNLLRDLGRVFREKEAKHVGLCFGVDYKPRNSVSFPVHDLQIELDDAASRSGGRLADVHGKYGALEARDPGAREAEKEGIVYHRLRPEDRNYNIGTLVNGAGLAMNTVDALAGHGGMAANFLDTGGKATSETVKKSFEIILQDDRVKVVFVNIFGGLTLGDMIARGIILAYKEVDIKVPVVVRIRGTNEKEGQRIVAESGLPLYAFEDFDEAAKKAVELARGTPGAEDVPQEGDREVAGMKDDFQPAAAEMLREGESDASDVGAGNVSEAATASEATGNDPAQREAANKGAGKPQDLSRSETEGKMQPLGTDHIA
ncbi:hypothetical protein diail_10684 [Diaporthe ilicicola]|nr:hypothetical protein diail_10684 [Diaporthe ilicicola]